MKLVLLCLGGKVQSEGAALFLYPILWKTEIQ